MNEAPRIDSRAVLARVLARIAGEPRTADFLAARHHASRRSIEAAFGSASRQLGKELVAPTAEERTALARAGVTWPIDRWSTDDLGRIVLLLDAAEAARATDDGEIARLVDDLYRHGENRERHAVLRALAFLPGPERFVDLAVNACRTSVQTVFESIACDNPFPAEHFPEGAFNQMTLKCLFTGAPLARVVGLAERTTPELVRMASAYESERRAAGRVVPEDVSRITGGALS